MCFGVGWRDERDTQLLQDDVVARSRRLGMAGTFSSDLLNAIFTQSLDQPVQSLQLQQVMHIQQKDAVRRKFGDLNTGDLILLIGCDIVPCPCVQEEWAKKSDLDSAQELRTGLIRYVSAHYEAPTLTYQEYVDLCKTQGTEPAF